MIFTTFEFAVFFLIVLCGVAFFRGIAARNWFLLIASYFFYMSWSVPFGALLLGVSLNDFLTARQIARHATGRAKKLLLVRSLAINLGVLAFFKYANFAWGNAAGLARLFGADLPPIPFDILLPVGISFFTFQSMSYTIDVYRGRLAPTERLRDYLLYVSFFPQLVAGPIVRAIDFLPQLAAKVSATTRDIEVGLGLIGLGVVKKMVVSDQIAGHVDVLFADPGRYDAFSLIQGALGYAVQIYCDFSGYSDIAIGCARIMGFRFPENFAMPYASSSITEFWRRWHISLSSWLRDYLYIPLGGNRAGAARTYANLIATMLLGGLWHGASWNFVLWGGIHGVALATNKLWESVAPPGLAQARGVYGFALRCAGWLATMTVVLAGWVFFRAQTFGSAMAFLGRATGIVPGGERFFSPYIWLALLGVGVAHAIFPKKSNWVERVADAPFLARAAVYTLLLLLIVCLGATDAAPFIYFQF